jgi:hypothetical protein
MDKSRIAELAEELAKNFSINLEEALKLVQRDEHAYELMDSAEKMAWSQLTAEQFISGYSEADAIYNKM